MINSERDSLDIIIITINLLPPDQPIENLIWLDNSQKRDKLINHNNNLKFFE